MITLKITHHFYHCSLFTLGFSSAIIDQLTILHHPFLTWIHYSPADQPTTTSEYLVVLVVVPIGDALNSHSHRRVTMSLSDCADSMAVLPERNTQRVYELRLINREPRPDSQP